MTNLAHDTTVSNSRAKHQVLAQLGEGGMGVVQLAVARGSEGFFKLVVLKSLKKELLGERDARQMFLDEARISARLSHPNLVRVYEVMDFEGAPTMVMEYLEGQPLQALITHRTPLPRHLQLHVLTKVLAGLHACHELRNFDGTPLGLIHRDISPHNVFILYDGEVRVLDFGIAKVKASSITTQTGEVKGKLHYMAPEQFAGRDQTRSVDLFAVGIMLWETIAGRRIWEDMLDSDIMLALLTNAIPPLPDTVEVSPELRAICQKALAPKPEDRYATAAEFQRALERHLAIRNEEGWTHEIAAYMEENFHEERAATLNVVNAHLKAIQLPADGSAPPERTDTHCAPLVHSDDQPRLSIVSLRPVKPRWLWAVAAALLVAGAAGFPLARRVMTNSAAGRARTGTALGPTPGETPACGAGFKACDGQCVSMDRPDYGCGSAACQRCSATNATLRCDGERRCGVAVCFRGFADCDDKYDTGCETDIRLDPDNCGTCGHRCPDLPHAQRGCGDVCTIWRCQPGHRDCNGIVADGCEVPVNDDVNNCGHCGKACSRGQTCREGKCTGGAGP